MNDLGQLGPARDLDPASVEEPGRLRAERPVHEDLEVADPQEVVSEAGADSEFFELLVALVWKRLPHAKGKSALVAERLEESECAETAVLVVHGGDSP